MIAETTRDILRARTGMDAEAVILAYGHAITRVLAAKGMVAVSAERRTVNVAKSFVVSADDMRRIIMIESMRGIFSETRIQAAVKFLDQEATPQIIGDRIGEMFRQFSMSIPEVALKLEQYDTAVTMVKLFNLDPQNVPNNLKAHPSLIALSSIANFMIFGDVVDVSMLAYPSLAVQEIKDACNEVLTIVKSAPSIESMSLAKFQDHFGEVPASSPDGIRRGLVLYSVLSQSSKMDIVDVVPMADGANVALVDPSYVKAAGLASALTGTLLTASSMTGLANIVADEMALEDVQMRDDCTFDPQLLTIQVSELDVMFLALARARSVAYVRLGGEGSANIRLIYGCNVEEQWRMSVMAATPSMAFFLDPASVIVYTSKMMASEPTAFPSRNQTIGAELMRDTHYVGRVKDFLHSEVEKPFTLSIPVTPYGGEPIVLDLNITVLGSLVGYDANPINRGTAYYAAVREPGVDQEVDLMLNLALAYAELPSTDIQGDKAKSWLIVHLAPLMMHPSVRLIAERAVTTAIIKARLDGRRLAPQMKEVYNRAFFGTTLAILNRFGKVDGAVVAALTKAIPTSTLSLQAALTLAQIPAAINGSMGPRG
jgi:hypothetical protein